MGRDRRKSFYDANRRIADMAMIPSQQSTSDERPRRKRAKEQESTEPLRRSNRLRGFQVDASSLIIPTRRQKRQQTSKTQTNVAEAAKELEKIKKRRYSVALERLNTATIIDLQGIPNPVQTRPDSPQSNVNIVQVAKAAEELEKIKKRRYFVALERLNPVTINEMLGIPNPVHTRPNSPQSNSTIAHVSPKKIVTRRFTVHLERMDLSAYRNLPSIEQNVNENQPDEHKISPEFEQQQPEAEPEREREPEQLMLIDPKPVEDVPPEKVASIDDDVPIDTDGSIEPETDAETYFDTTSTIASGQNVEFVQSEMPRPSTPTPPPRTRSHSPFTPGKIVHELMDTTSNDSNDSTVLIGGLRFPDDIASTYLHISNNSASRAMVPFRNRHLQSSQTETLISWTPHGSISQDSVAVGYSQSMSDIFIDKTGVVEPKKGFIDSNHVSYGSTIKYKTDIFAINWFDHGNDAIEHHFLSKFCRSYCSTLNAQFTGQLYATQTTARLMFKYSTIDRQKIQVLKYGEKTPIGNANVTAIEVPNFPGGALFLFEANTEKTIVHVGNFRLTTELELDAALSNSKIDDIRFDESILTGLFYHSTPATDRYMDLMQATAKFTNKSIRNGLSHVIAIGATEIGMEYLIHRLAANFDSKVYVSDERRAFLECMELDFDEDTVIQKLLRLLVSKPEDALIHVVPVDDISQEKLMKYKEKYNYMRALGIRPRGCESVLQTVVNGVIEIVDVANPLIGDLVEYERFVYVHTDDEARVPSNHGDKQAVADSTVVRYEEESE